MSLALATSSAFALGLGDIEMRSALNQPMNAEIRLTSVKPGELDGMIVKLASADAFARAGIERSQALTSLRFAVDESGGAPVIRISSSQPVVEPFLNFLLEVDWPQGRMVREYTVLLDPPVFMTPSASSSSTLDDSAALDRRDAGALVAPAPIERDSAAAVADSFDVELVDGAAERGDVVSLDGLADSAPSVDAVPLPGGEGEIVSLTDAAAPNTDAAAQRAAESFDFDVELVGDATEVADDVAATEAASTAAPDSELVSLDDSEIVELGDLQAPEASTGNNAERTVQQGDTLFEIASDVAGEGVSVEQMMVALLAANRSAFIEGNINLVRAGSILRVPPASEALALTQAQAVAEVGKQARLWQEYRDGLRSSGGTRLAATDTDTAAPDDSAADAGDDDAAAEETGLSASAQAILDNARREILEREDLRIVGEGSSSSEGVATPGEARDGDATARLGDIEQRLQLAREELTSTRQEAADLGEQAGELRSTTENFDALIALRQNDIAALESRLAEARDESTTGALDAVGDAAQEGVDSVAEAADDVATDVAEVGSEVAEAGSDAADTARNALTDAGQQLDSVELVGDSEEQVVAEVAPADAIVEDAEPVSAAPERPWYQTLMADPARLAIAGVGGAALLGVLGTLLWRRRRSDDGDAWMEGEDDVEFIDGDNLGDTASPSAAVGGVAAAGAATVAAAAVATRDDRDDEAGDAFDDTVAYGRDDAPVAPIDAGADDGIDKDDTISEVDVYLAYGLHGQAEELLTRAIDREPNNPVYARKLLDTYHAQGNGEAFERSADAWHARFGGASNPEWPAIAAMGHELRPQSDLFAGAASNVDQVGSASFGADRFEIDDFADLGEPGAAKSISRDFDGAEEGVSFDAANLDDESALMDQSLDPAFAFDEGDLEATGDFSAIADEVAAESDEGIIDFPAFDDEAAPVAPSAPRGEAAQAMDGLDAPELMGGAASLAAEADASGSLADDLTLDLDQLSGELELDGTELLDDNVDGLSADAGSVDFGNVEALEIPDLTADNDLLTGEGGDADEVDTMMDLAKAYIDMGDKDSASSTLGEIVKSGNPDQVTEAETLLRKIS